MPEIKPTKDLRFRSPNGKLALRAQMFHPVSNADTFVTSNAGTSVKRDIGFFAPADGAGAGVAVSGFYVGANLVKDFTLGDTLNIINSACKDVIIVRLDGPTHVA